MIDETVMDPELVKEVQKRDPHTTTVFEYLVKRHEKKVYALCYWYIGRMIVLREIHLKKIFQ
jgi:hypothetical protein